MTVTDKHKFTDHWKDWHNKWHIFIGKGQILFKYITLGRHEKGIYIHEEIPKK